MNLSLVQNDPILEGHPAIINIPRNAATILSMFAGLVAFEIFNYATTFLALRSLLGGLTVIGFNLTAWLAAAVCCLDVTGIIHLFLPPEGQSNLKNNHNLFIAWILVTGLNAWLIWLGVSQAISIRQAQTGLVIDAGILAHILPIVLVSLIWLVRILVIGALASARLRIGITANRKADPIPPEESYDHQPQRPFDLLPHGTENQYGSPYSFNPSPIGIREPTYRGIPVRFKTS
jgi:hypothetical protein